MDEKALDALIDQFEVVLKTGKGLGLPRPDWKAVWAKAAEIQNGFRQVHYPSKQERDNAWERFVAIREEASALGKHDSDERRWKSEYHLEVIVHQVESARPVSLIAFGVPDVAEMKQLGMVLNEGRKMLSANKDEMLGEHKQECFTRIQEMQESHDAWWVHLKQIRSTERQDRIRANLERNHERHRKASDALDSYRSRVDELRAKIALAYNPSWAEGASERLAELEEKIEDIEESLEKIEDWIRKDEEQLEDS